MRPGPITTDHGKGEELPPPARHSVPPVGVNFWHCLPTTGFGNHALMRGYVWVWLSDHGVKIRFRPQTPKFQIRTILGCHYCFLFGPIGSFCQCGLLGPSRLFGVRTGRQIQRTVQCQPWPEGVRQLPTSDNKTSSILSARNYLQPKSKLPMELSQTPALCSPNLQLLQCKQFGRPRLATSIFHYAIGHKQIFHSVIALQTKFHFRNAFTGLWSGRARIP